MDLKQTLEAEADQMLNLMKAELENTGKVMPSAVGFCPTGKLHYSPRYSTTEKKRAVFRDFDEELKRKKATGAIIGVESWAVFKRNPSKEDLDKVWPSRDPYRQEALVVVAVSKDWTMMRAVPFFRGEMGPVYLDEVRVEGGTALQQFVHAFD